MRKIMTVVLAVLMLVSAFAAIPASAAAATTTTYDGTTKDTVNKIIITEVAPKVTYHPNGAAEAEDAKKYPMGFVELFNNSTEDIQLDSLSLLKGVSIQKEPKNTDPYYEAADGTKLWRLWRDNKKFISKMDLEAGEISTNLPADIDPVIAAYLTNEGQDMTFSSGENVVIWFITPDTIEWMTKAEGNKANFDPRAEFMASFGFNKQATAKNYTILMVWAWDEFNGDDIATDMFTLSAPNTEDRDYIYGVANDSWDVAEDMAYDKETKTINEGLYNMVVMGVSVPRYDKMPNADKAATFGSPAIKPYIANAYEALTEINPVEFVDGLQAGLVSSYREASVINWSADPTPGEMLAWQWAMVNPDGYAAFKTNDVKDDAKVQAAVDAYIKELKLIDDGTAGRQDGTVPNYNWQTQEELREQFFGGGDDNTGDDEGGLSTLVLILIIVGGVVVLGGAACVVIFVVVLPKKKAAAAAAVEAPVEEAPVEEAPVEEAPVEEAPVEEAPVEEAPVEEEAPTEE